MQQINWKKFNIKQLKRTVNCHQFQLRDTAAEVLKPKGIFKNSAEPFKGFRVAITGDDGSLNLRKSADIIKAVQVVCVRVGKKDGVDMINATLEDLEP